MNAGPVLIVDDFSNMRLLLASMLRQLGFTDIDEAVHGDHALKLFNQRRHPLVYLDINMPGRNGIEVLKQIMALAPTTYAIMQTGERESEAVNASIEAGARGYVVKPYNFNAIKQGIARFRDGVTRN